MDSAFTIDLTQNQADFLNSILPKFNSIQPLQILQKRRKAQKKLDDMYVSDFSLRPVKKIKIQHQNNQSKPQIPSINSQLFPSQRYSLQVDKNSHHIKSQEKDPTRPNENIKRVEKKQYQAQKQPQVFQPHTSRSQRVSKPTFAYLQFQQQTFKKKIAERTQPNILSKEEQSNLGKVQKSQQSWQRRRQQRKDRGEKIELQKQASAKIQIQPIQQRPQQSIIQGAKLATKLYDHPIPNQKFPIIAAQIPYYPQNQHLLQSSVKSPCNHQRNLLDIQANFQHNNLQNSQILQNSQQQMPNLKSTKKQSNHQNNASSIPQSKFSVNSYKFQDENDYRKRCWVILQRLKIHKSSWPFRHPVDPQTQGVPDYFEKIKNPMDLKTIEKKLRGQKYRSAEEFYADVNLMMENSLKYNAPTTKYYKLTVELEDYFKQLKMKSQLPISARKYSTENNEEQSDYEVEEENVEKSRKVDEKPMNQRVEYNQKSLKPDNRKRTAAEYENSSIGPVANRKIAKVFITNEGAIRKDKKSQSQNEINKSNIKSQPKKLIDSEIHEIGNQSVKKSAQIRQINEKKSNKKEFKLIRIEPNQNQTLNHLNQIQNKEQRHKQLRFGYPQNKISLIQRQTLLYDILHIQQPTIRNQLESFFDMNHKIFKPFKHLNPTNHHQSNGQNIQKNYKMEIQSDSYELELKDFDQESYKMLRNEVDRLIQLQRDGKKAMEGPIEPIME